MNGLDLFSGIGGISLALHEWVKPVAYCEIDKYCQAVLLSRMSNGQLPRAPIWDDIVSLDGHKFYGHIDIIYGGFPCQDISCAGLGKGLEGKRSGLFFEILRLAKEIKPSYIFLENVPAITSRGGLQVVREIAEMGYDCRWCVISAASVGALHRRERWFLLAHSKHDGAFASTDGCSTGKVSETREQHEQAQVFWEAKRASSLSGNVAGCNTNSQPSQQADTSSKPYTTERDARGRLTRFYWPLESVEHWKETVRSMDKCSNGLPYHIHRLRALGNAVVPEQVRQAFITLVGTQRKSC